MTQPVEQLVSLCRFSLAEEYHTLSASAGTDHCKKECYVTSGIWPHRKYCEVVSSHRTAPCGQASVPLQPVRDMFPQTALAVLLLLQSSPPHFPCPSPKLHQGPLRRRHLTPPFPAPWRWGIAESRHQVNIFDKLAAVIRKHFHFFFFF